MRSFKSKVAACLAICITAILGIAVCGCDDLGAYENTEEYYASFGDVVLIGGEAEEGKSYSVEKYFYNKESREDFLENSEDKIAHSDYVYVAIPVVDDIKMDSLAMYLQAKEDVVLHVCVYITDDLPAEWKVTEESETVSTESLTTSEVDTEESLEEKITETSFESADSDTEEETEEFKAPAYESRIGEITLHLKDGKWNSFVLDSFSIDNKVEKSVNVEGGQYIVLQIRNNMAVFDEEKQCFIDPQTGAELEKAEITMTNLLIRALE